MLGSSWVRPRIRCLGFILATSVQRALLFKPLCRRFFFEEVLPSKMFRIVGAFIASLVMHPFSVVHGLEAASTANETAKDETVTASSSGGSYECHLPLNCYAGHGADEVDYVGEVASISSCAESCNGMSDWQCEGFVYMGSQRKCWRRRNINLPACDVGEWNKESSEFITCLRQD